MGTEQYRKKSALSIFLSFFKPHLGLFALDMGCALLVSAVDLTFPLVTRRALNELLPQKAYTVFFIVIIALIAAYAVRAVLQFVITYWGHTFGIRVEADIRAALFTHMQELSFSFYDQHRTGKLMSRLTTDLFDVTELAHHGPEDIITSVLTIIGALILMFTIQWRLALVVALLLPIAMTVTLLRRKSMRAASSLVKAKQAAINAEIESSLSGMRTAKAFANENVEINKFMASNDEFKVSKRGFHKAMGLFQGSIEFFICALSVAVIGVGGWLVMDGRANYVDILTFTLYVSTFTTPVRKLAGFAETLSNGGAGLRRFVELMRTEPEMKDAPDAVELKNVKGELRVEHVDFSYNEANGEVLHDVSLHAEPGEVIAIVGPSGGGKSTLCQLIPRFYDVSRGSISIDGHDIRQITKKSLRDSIGIVQQDVFLFAATIRDNIRYGRPDASDEEVAEAAKRAEIYDDIVNMPDGFDTWVGERGVLLSGGQKQRIAIARVFLKNPPLLILDEATSALDSVTEARIQNAFDELSVGRTTLIIAHRLSTVKNAGRILVVDGGEIREQGTHAQLMEAGGEYAKLYRTQQLLA